MLLLGKTAVLGREGNRKKGGEIEPKRRRIRCWDTWASGGAGVMGLRSQGLWLGSCLFTENRTGSISSDWNEFYEADMFCPDRHFGIRCKGLRNLFTDHCIKGTFSNEGKGWKGVFTSKWARRDMDLIGVSKKKFEHWTLASFFIPKWRPYDFVTILGFMWRNDFISA